MKKVQNRNDLKAIIQTTSREMLTMQNAWEIQHADTIERTNFETSHNARADSNTNANNNNNTVMNNSQGLTFGELMERSLSAPPLRNDMNESLGSIRSGSGRTQVRFVRRMSNNCLRAMIHKRTHNITFHNVGYSTLIKCYEYLR